MTTESRRQILWTLREFVHGRVGSDELRRCLDRARAPELGDLLERLCLEREDFDVLALSEPQLRDRLDAFLAGTLDFREFSDWASQVYRVFSTLEYRRSRRFSERVDRAVMLLALLVDTDLTESIEHSRALCSRLANVLRRGHALPSESILRRLFLGKREIHFVSAPVVDHFDGQVAAEEWVDLALVRQPDDNGLAATLDLPFSAEFAGDAGFGGFPEFDGDRSDDAEDRERAGWFVPIAVCTHRFFIETRPDGAWCHPENDKMLALRDQFPADELFPNLKPHYYVDQDGLVEVVLEVEEIGPAALRAAAHLFCLRNGITQCYLDGAPLFPVKEEL